jgi:hypothetical protein
MKIPYIESRNTLQCRRRTWSHILPVCGIDRLDSRSNTSGHKPPFLNWIPLKHYLFEGITIN